MSSMVASAARRSGRWITAIIAAMVLGIVVLVTVTDPPASRVLTSDPVDGAVLADAPTVVSILFSDEVTARDYHLSVVPARGGAAVSQGAPRLTGTELTVPVAVTAEGDYLATYHVELGEGDVAAGSVRFAVGGEASPGPTTAASGHAHGSRDPWNAALLVLDLLLVGAVLLMLFRRPGRHSPPPKPWRLDPRDQ
jgi:methionine-rich copper-binding protein CopC